MFHLLSKGLLTGIADSTQTVSWLNHSYLQMVERAEKQNDVNAAHSVPRGAAWSGWKETWNCKRRSSPGTLIPSMFRETGLWKHTAGYVTYVTLNFITSLEETTNTGKHHLIWKGKLQQLETQFQVLYVESSLIVNTPLKTHPKAKGRLETVA